MAESAHTSSPWLARALAVSAVVHLAAVIVMRVALSPSAGPTIDTVDIEIAPAPPKAEALPKEVARPIEEAPPEHEEQAAAATTPQEHDEPTQVDAGVDAARDAPIDARDRPDAAADAAIDAAIDAPIDAPIDAAPMVAAEGDAGTSAPDDAPQVAAIGAGSAVGSGSAGLGSAAGSGSGVPAAVALGSGSGAPGMTDEPAVDGAPTTAGTAANLLAYFPPGHVVTAMLRFDRLRGGEWEARTERLLRPLPDYHALFGDREANIGDKFDTLIISTPRPRDATATTLVVHSRMSRSEVRNFLANPQTSIAWSTAKGGMLGKRSGKLFQGDKRVVLSPWKSWFVLAQPADLGGLIAASAGSLDALEAKGKLPPWLGAIRDVEKESGDDKRGPALVVTLAGEGKRYAIPDAGLGITSLPAPERVSLAMELVKQGWLVRGNIKFANEADATLFVQSVQDVQQRIGDSHVLSRVLAQQHALNMITGLSLARTGARVSYATSLSIADARALLAAAAVTLDDYFGHAP